MTDEPVCDWTWCDDDDGWSTSCDAGFIFNDGGPVDNDFKFCPYCGKPIKEYWE